MLQVLLLIGVEWHENENPMGMDWQSINFSSVVCSLELWAWNPLQKGGRYET